ncbi:MAG: ATP-binding protein, partial [Candidatus Eisenbacteria bacterium]
MVPPRLLTLGRYAAFGACVIIAASIREAPSDVITQAIIWMPTGVAVAGVWLLGLRAAFVVAACTLLQRFLIGYDPGMAVPAAFGSGAEALVGALVLRRLDFRASQARLRDVGALLAAASIAPLASIAFSWIGRSLFWSHAPFYAGWDGWWRMNALGLLTVVPVVVHWSELRRDALDARFVLGTLLAIVGIPTLTFVAMSQVPTGVTGVLWLNLVLIVVLYAAVRFGVRGATLAGSLAAITVAMATTRGVGPFIGLGADERHVVIQLFELSFVAIPLTAGALTAERETAQARGARSDELRVALQSALPDILYRLDREGICLEVFVPPGIESPLPPAAFIGRSMYEFFPPERHADIKSAILASFERGEAATLEYDLEVQGRHRYREARCVPNGELEVLAVVRDITDRKWAESTREFEARVLALVASGHLRGEVLAELVTGIERLLPGSRCAVLMLEGDGLRVAMAPSLSPGYHAVIESVRVGPDAGLCALAAYQGRRVITPELAGDPRCAPLYAQLEPYGLHACWSIPIKDATGGVLGTFTTHHSAPRPPEPAELELAERAAALAGIVLDRENRVEALRRSEDLLASLNRNVKEGLFRATPALELVYVNEALARLLGYDAPQAVIGRSLAEAVDDPVWRDLAARSFARTGAWRNEELRFRRADGGTFWGLLSVTAVRGADGEITHHDGAIADITARKELEEQFRQSQKMEAVGKLAGGVAHDFNNLLTVILGYADTIHGSAAAGTPERAYAAQVVDAANRASGLTRQLLAYSRQQVLSPQVLELAAVVDEMGDMLRRLIGEDIRLVIEHHDGPCWVRVDRSQLEQVLLNLAVNARDAMRGGGTLTLATTLTPGGTPSHPDRERLPGPAALLSVRDTGAGMNPDVQTRAFDPFFTTKAPGEGTGLGLSTVYGIVKQSGGAVWFESSEGTGTTFWIALPNVATPPEVVVPHGAPVSGVRTATLLVVEDESVVRGLVRRTLELDGHRVIEA